MSDEKKIHRVHDRYSKRSLSKREVALDMFQDHIPKRLLKKLLLDEYELVKESFISVNLREKDYRRALQDTQEEGRLQLLLFPDRASANGGPA